MRVQNGAAFFQGGQPISHGAIIIKYKSAPYSTKVIFKKDANIPLGDFFTSDCEEPTWNGNKKKPKTCSYTINDIER